MVLVLVGVAGVSGLLGSGDAVQASGTPRLSISSAAFTPWKHDGAIGAKYENHGRFLKHLGPDAVGTLGSYWYIAPIYLPDGVTLTKVIAHWYQQNPVAKGQFKLQRTKFGQGNYEDLVVVESGTTTGYGSTFTTTISQAIVDNSQYSYWVLFYLPASDGTIGLGDKNVWGCGAQIEYSSAVFMPVIAK